MTKTTKPVASIDLLIPSIKGIYNNLPVFFLLLVVPALLSLIRGTMPEVPEQPTVEDLVSALNSAVTPFMMLGGFLALIFYPLLTAAQWRAAKQPEKTVSFASLRKLTLQQYFRLIGVLLLTFVAVFFGLILFILPGIIAFRMFALAPFYLLERDLGVVESMKTAARETKPYSWSIYGILGIIILFTLFGAAGGVIGVVLSNVLTLLYNLAFALRFHEINGLSKRNA